MNAIKGNIKLSIKGSIFLGDYLNKVITQDDNSKFDNSSNI